MTGKLPFEKGTRKVLVRKDHGPSTKYGEDPSNRSIETLINYGVVNVNKPRGPTSHQVSAYVQQILGIKKSGHSGTLDPNVSGCLPVCLGRGTRVVQGLLTAGKEYVCIMHIHKSLDESEVRKVLDDVVGRIKQMPPIKSSVKRQYRYRNIYYIDVLEIDGQDVLFKVGCQAGTYIRKLCHDIGQELKVGAHMAKLVRSKAGPFKLEDAWTLQDLRDALHFYKEENNEKFIRKIIRPIEEAVAHLPKVWVVDPAVANLCHGANLHIPGVSKVETHIQPEDKVAVFTLRDEFIGFGVMAMTSKQALEKERGVVVKMEKIFMERGLYPKV